MPGRERKILIPLYNMTFVPRLRQPVSKNCERVFWRATFGSRTQFRSITFRSARVCTKERVREGPFAWKWILLSLCGYGVCLFARADEAVNRNFVKARLQERTMRWLLGIETNGISPCAVSPFLLFFSSSWPPVVTVKECVYTARLENISKIISVEEGRKVWSGRKIGKIWLVDVGIGIKYKIVSWAISTIY